MIFKRVVLFALIGLATVSDVKFLHAENQPVIGQNNVENGDFNIDSMQDFYQEMVKIWAEAKKREDERKILYFSKLSEQHQGLLKNAQDLYNKFLEDVDIRNGLAKLCQDVRCSIEQLRDGLFISSENMEVLNDVLVKIQKLQMVMALDYCPFLPARMKGMGSGGMDDLSGIVSSLMQNIVQDDKSGDSDWGPSDEGVLEDSDTMYSREDLASFCESLTALSKSGIIRVSKDEGPEVVALKAKTENLVGILKEMLLCFLNNKQKELALCYMRYLTPRLDEVFKLLKDTKLVFEEEIKGYITDLSVNIFDNTSSDENISQKAYVFWLKEIKKNQRALLVFAKLKEDINSPVAGTERLFEFVAYSYDFLSCLNGFYTKDMREKGYGVLSKELLIPKAVDWGFSGAMAAWYFFLKRPDAISSFLLQVIYGSIPPNMISTKDFMVSNSMAATVSLFVLFNPSTWNWQPQKLSKALGKTFGSWIYYYWIYGEWLGNDHALGWPSDYKHFKKSVYNLLKEFEKTVSMHIASAIRNKTDPETLDSIERYTLGVVNPELLWYFVDTMTPLILFSNFEQPFRFKELDATEGANYSVQEVAKLLDVPEFKVEGWVKAGLKASENKISGKDLDEFLMNHGHHRGFYLVNPEQNYSIQDLSKRLHVSDRTITELWLTSGLKITADGNILGRNLVDFLTARAADNKNPVFGLYDNDLFITESVACDYENFSEEDKRRVSLKSFYVETCISYYVASCVGRTLGAAITRKFQGPILNFLSYTGDKFLDGLAKLHIIGKDTREICTGVKEEFIDGIDESIMVLKMVLKEGLAPQSPIREMIVARLGKRGTISANQDSSVDDQNKELLRLVLKHCRLKHLITHLDAANIMQYFLTKKQIDDELIDKIVTALRNNLLASVGGWIGELAANGGVNLLTNWKGPMQLYPSKLMKYVNA